VVQNHSSLIKIGKASILYFFYLVAYYFVFTGLLSLFTWWIYDPSASIWVHFGLDTSLTNDFCEYLGLPRYPTTTDTVPFSVIWKVITFDFLHISQTNSGMLIFLKNLFLDYGDRVITLLIFSQVITYSVYHMWNGKKRKPFWRFFILKSPKSLSSIFRMIIVTVALILLDIVDTFINQHWDWRSEGWYPVVLYGFYAFFILIYSIINNLILSFFSSTDPLPSISQSPVQFSSHETFLLKDSFTRALLIASAMFALSFFSFIFGLTIQNTLRGLSANDHILVWYMIIIIWHTFWVWMGFVLVAFIYQLLGFWSTQRRTINADRVIQITETPEIDTVDAIIESNTDPTTNKKYGIGNRLRNWAVPLLLWGYLIFVTYISRDIEFP